MDGAADRNPAPAVRPGCIKGSRPKMSSEGSVSLPEYAAIVKALGVVEREDWRGEGETFWRKFPLPPSKPPPFPFKDFHKRGGRRLRDSGGPVLGGSFPERLFSCYVLEGPLQRIMAFPPGKIFATNIFSVARREIY